MLLLSAEFNRRTLNHARSLLGVEVPPAKRAPIVEFMLKMRELKPFMWPKSDRYLQFMIFLSIALLLAGRVVNVLVPLQYKVVVDALAASATGPIEFPLAQLLLFVTYKFLQVGKWGCNNFTYGAYALLRPTGWQRFNHDVPADGMDSSGAIHYATSFIAHV